MIEAEDWDLGDILRASLGHPLDALAAIPAVDQQVRAATPNELAAIEVVAEKAARLQDEIKAAVGEKGGELRKLKDQLKQSLLQHGLKELTIAGRPPIELSETKNRKPTRKAIVATMQDALVDELGEVEAKKEGKIRAFKLWASIKPTIGHSLSIPDPSPPDIEPSY